MALHISISGDKFPAGGNKLRGTVFRNRAGLLRDLEDAVEFFAQCRHILSDLVVGDAGIDLGRGDPFVSQHLRYGFQRYALCKRDRRGEGMTPCVE